MVVNPGVVVFTRSPAQVPKQKNSPVKELLLKHYGRIYSSDAIEATNTGFRRSRLRRRGQSGSFLLGFVDRTKSEFGFYSLIPFYRHPTHWKRLLHQSQP
jgi:hypothetical protein